MIIRQLWKHKGFSAIAVVTLMLGIGVNLALFAQFNEQLLRPRGFAHPEELYEVLPSDGSGEQKFFNCTRYYYEAIRQHNRVFKGVVGCAGNSARLRTADGWEEIRLKHVSSEFFDFLGVQPVLGRGFLPEEGDSRATPRVAVISHAFWQSHFAGDREVLGRTIDLNGHAVEIIGVAPQGFYDFSYVNYPPLLWVPVGMDDLFSIVAPGYRLIGRLDVEQHTPLEAAASLAAVVREVTETLTASKLDFYSSNIAGFTNVCVIPAGRGTFPVQFRSVSKPRQKFALAAVGTLLVLLLAVFNLAAFAFSMVLRRTREIGIRMALGASRWAIIKQHLLEGTVLSLLGTGAALLLLGWISRVLSALAPTIVGDSSGLVMDVRVVAAATTLALTVGIGFSLWPALRASRLHPLLALRDGSDCLSGPGRRWSPQLGLMVLQVAGSFALFSGLCLCGYSFYKQVHSDLGFDPKKILVASLDLEPAGYQGERARVLVQELQDRFARMPHVESVGMAAVPPFHRTSVVMSMGPEGIDGYTLPAGQQATYDFRYLGANYFTALGVPLLLGRDISEADYATGQEVAIVNEAFVRRFWPNQDVLSRVITLGRTHHYPIVGVVRDTHLVDPDEPVEPTVYFSASPDTSLQPTFVIRTDVNPDGLGEILRSQLKSVHPRLGASVILGMRKLMERSLWAERKAMSFLGALSLTALVLVVLGIWGMMASRAARMSREIGVRLALGATRANIGRHLFGFAFKVGLLGMALGIPFAVWGFSLLRHSSYQIQAGPGPALIGAVILIQGAILVSCLPPIWRASRIDPMEALRDF